jgi:hypothetical protein
MESVAPVRPTLDDFFSIVENYSSSRGAPASYPLDASVHKRWLTTNAARMAPGSTSRPGGVGTVA